MSVNFWCPLEDDQTALVRSLLAEEQRIRVSVATSEANFHSPLDENNSAPLEVSVWDMHQWKPDGLAVCVKPLHGAVAANALMIAEFLSYYKLMGVKHVTMYNYSHTEPASISVLKEQEEQVWCAFISL
jgi:hypothetical protein